MFTISPVSEPGQKTGPYKSPNRDDFTGTVQTERGEGWEGDTALAPN